MMTNGGALADLVAVDSLLHGHLLAEPLQRVLPLELLKLCGSVLIEELVDAEVPTAHTNVDAAMVNLDVDSLGSELVDALALTHEHDLELGPLRVVVNVLGEALVNRVVLDRDVNGNPALEVDDVSLQSVDLLLGVPQPFEQVKASVIRHQDFAFQLCDVLAGTL